MFGFEVALPMPSSRCWVSVPAPPARCRECLGEEWRLEDTFVDVGDRPQPRITARWGCLRCLWWCIVTDNHEVSGHAGRKSEGT
jgi:hypothetical protein